MNVLVIVAHADDEVIGVGGTLRKMANAGANIRLLMFSEGAEGYTAVGERDRIVAARDEETRRVCDVLGIGEYFNLHGLDWNLSVDNAGYHAVIRHIREHKPHVVFTHSRADYNDHIAVHDTAVEGWFHASIPCAMADGDPWPRPPLYEFEVLQPMSHPTVVVDVTETYEAKVQAMGIYASQHGLVGGVFQLIEGRALQRGFQIGVKYGEALKLSDYRPRRVCDASDLARI